MKVQVNFDIPLFEGQIDVDALDKWLNVLEGYFSVHKFFDKEKITFVLLKVVPHVQNWWGTYCEQKYSDESGMFETNPKSHLGLFHRCHQGIVLPCGKL